MSTEWIWIGPCWTWIVLTWTRPCWTWIVWTWTWLCAGLWKRACGARSWLTGTKPLGRVRPSRISNWGRNEGRAGDTGRLLTDRNRNMVSPLGLLLFLHSCRENDLFVFLRLLFSLLYLPASSAVGRGQLFFSRGAVGCRPCGALRRASSLRLRLM